MEIKVPTGRIEFNGSTVVIRKHQIEKRIPVSAITAIDHRPSGPLAGAGEVVFSIGGESASSKRGKRMGLMDDLKRENGFLYPHKVRAQVAELLDAIESARA